MIGWINLSVEAFICDSFGRDAWLQIIKKAHVDCNWVSSCPYPDKVTYDLVITGAGILGVTVPQALEAYGQYFVNYVIKQGYTRLLKSLGSNIAEFLANLNNLHLHLTLGFPSMVAPAFRVEQVTSTSLLLHYYSTRPALWPIVSGVLKGASKCLFDLEVELELVASREAGDCDHEIFKVTYPHQESLSHWDNHDAALASEFAMTKDFFYDMFPFHIILDTSCCVVQAGGVVTRLFGDTLTRGSHISDTFKLRHPYIPFDYDRMVIEADSLYLLKAFKTGLELKGQMVKTAMPDGRTVLLFLGSPRVATLEEMTLHGLYLSDIPLHDMSRDFVLLAEQRQAEADLKERFETLAVDLRVANQRLEQATRWLDEERQRSDALLYRMLPADIAADLREGRKVEAISYPEVTILFSDMVGFTTTSAKSTPEEVYNMLNAMYDRFDGLVDEFPDIYKLETIGDAYFLVCNLTTECHNHVDTVIDFAIRMQEKARHVKNAQGEPVQIRIGIHTGPVVGGVLGAKTPRFSVYGDTVNVASRMESHGLPGKIHISEASYNRIMDKGKYAVRERGNIAVKGRGNMTTYLIGGTQDDWLLRHTSFDAQIDGGSAAGRDGSFIITASGRSMDSMGSSRPLLNNSTAMNPIKEGEEGEIPAKPAAESPVIHPSRSNPQLASGGIPSGASNSNSNGQLGNLLGRNSMGVAAGGANAAAGGPGPFPLTSGAGSTALQSVEGSRSAVSDALLTGAIGPAAGAAAAAAAAAILVGPQGGAAAGSPAGSYRETLTPSSSVAAPPIGREGSVLGLGQGGGPPLTRAESVTREGSVTRDTSFRAVYARGGRQGASSPLVSSSQSRKAASATAGSQTGGGGGGGGFPAAPTSDTEIASGGSTLMAAPMSAQHVPYELSPLSRPEASGGSSIGAGLGLPSGIVKARSATSKQSPLAAQAASGAAAAAATAGVGATVTAAAEAGPAAVALGPGRPSGAGSLVSQGSGLQPLLVPDANDTVPNRGSSPSSGITPSYAPTELLRASGTGDSVVPPESGPANTPPGKVKGLAGKLKSLFKK